MMNELIDKLDRYLDGESSLENFELWLYDLSFDIEQKVFGPPVDLVHDIEGLLAEASSGHWSESTLRSELELAVAHFRVSPKVFRYREKSVRRGRFSSPTPLLLRGQIVV